MPIYQVLLGRPDYVDGVHLIAVEVIHDSPEAAIGEARQRAAIMDTAVWNCIDSDQEYVEVKDTPNPIDYTYYAHTEVKHIMDIKLFQRKFHRDGSSAPAGSIFVFGSNLTGIHGAGAAKAAHQNYGAQWGVGEGHTGSSYAIPTVKEYITGPQPIEEVKAAVDRFLTYARLHPTYDFFVTRVGCGLAGFDDKDIAPMFKEAPANCSLPITWKVLIEN